MKVDQRYEKVPPLFDMAPKEGQEEAYKALREWVEADGGNVVLLGSVGCGKTHLVIAAGKEIERAGTYSVEEGYLAKERRHVCFVNVPSLLADLRAAISSGNEETADRFHHLTKNCVRLILDDLGAERLTEYAAEMLYVLIDGVYRREARVAVTTNVPLKDIVESGAGRIVSRLVEEAKLVKMTGKDLRLETFKRP